MVKNRAIFKPIIELACKKYRTRHYIPMTETLLIPFALLTDLIGYYPSSNKSVEIEIGIEEVVLDSWCYSSMNHTEHHTGIFAMGLISINNKKLGTYKRIEKAVEKLLEKNEISDLQEYIV